MIAMVPIVAALPRVCTWLLLINLAFTDSSQPVSKRIQWFISDRPSNLTMVQKFLLHDNREVAQGVYFCCGGLSFAPNGSAVLGKFDSSVVQPFRDAGMTVAPTFGGEGLPLTAWKQRKTLANEITQWVLANNFTGIHNDWEQHGDVGVGAHYFYEFWDAVAQELHRQGLTIGTVVETAPNNVSHPWLPRTLPNDTIWHSYIHQWDYPLGIPFMDTFTNMNTYPCMSTTDGNNDWCKDMCVTKHYF